MNSDKEIGRLPRVVVVVRCHTLAPFVVDTVDSIRHYSVTNPIIVVAVDRSVEVAEYVKRECSDVKVFLNHKVCGWGSGMHRLFCEVMRWIFEQGLQFDFLIHQDYDLIFTGRGADVRFLPAFEDARVGMVGKHTVNNLHWASRFRSNLNKIAALFNKSGKQFPLNYRLGEHCAGAFNIFSYQCLWDMYRMGFLSPPFSDICERVDVADDPLISFFVVAAGYKMMSLGTGAHIEWRLSVDYKRLGEDICVFHPTKIVEGNKPWVVSRELECRNYFREKRGQLPMSVEGLPKTAGPHNIMLRRS